MCDLVNYNTVTDVGNRNVSHRDTPLTYNSGHKIYHYDDAPLAKAKLPAGPAKIGQKWAAEFKKNKAILGVFDEGCMGMYNAIIPDELLHPTGVYKERLSQSALYAAMRTVSVRSISRAAQAVRRRRAMPTTAEANMTRALLNPVSPGGNGT